MIERIVIIDAIDPQTFYGVNNCNISLIRNLFPKLRMAARGNVIKVIGEDSETAEFEKKIKEIEAYACKYNKLSEDVIIDVIKGEPPKEMSSEGVIIFGQNGDSQFSCLSFFGTCIFTNDHEAGLFGHRTGRFSAKEFDFFTNCCFDCF